MKSFLKTPRDEVVDFSWQCIRIERTRPTRNKFRINEIWVVYFVGLAGPPVRRLNNAAEKWAAKCRQPGWPESNAAESNAAEPQVGRIETPTEREVRLGSRLQGPFIGEDKSAAKFFKAKNDSH
jgi:hypothetical protein